MKIRIPGLEGYYGKTSELKTNKKNKTDAPGFISLPFFTSVKLPNMRK